MKPFKVEGLPASVRVGPFDFRLVVESFADAASRGRYGEFRSVAGSIVIQAEFPSGLRAADTLIHEVLHACWWVAGLEDGDEEERTVNTLAIGLTQVWRDNPDLMGWIEGAVRG